MINRPINLIDDSASSEKEFFKMEKKIYSGFPTKIGGISEKKTTLDLPEILVITSYPPRICGIATYSQDLIQVLRTKFSGSFSIKVCALETGNKSYDYPVEVKLILDTSYAPGYEKIAETINHDNQIKLILIQHEFGFFQSSGDSFQHFLNNLIKPVIITFHTVLPHPDETLLEKVQNIVSSCESLIVMTKCSAMLLTEFYGVPSDKIYIIPHGTHLVPHLSKELLKKKYGLSDHKVLSTFGLLSSGKNIETTLYALPAIIETTPDVMFLIIGKTHPEVVKSEGESYRKSLETIIIQNNLTANVRFIDRYLALPELLEFLQLTDIYLFTTNDPNQAVSGTFSYAMSCACPIISTPIPHAREVLTEETGIIIDFKSSTQLAAGVIRLFNDEPLRKSISLNTLQKIVSTAWENSAIAHSMLFGKTGVEGIKLHYDLPPLKLNHLKLMTTETGIIQFSKINQPDTTSGYTLDDNARALIAMDMYYRVSGDKNSVFYIRKYLSFIGLCQQAEGNFLNYLDFNNKFTDQNNINNLDDANGRAIWALGFLTTNNLLPDSLILEAVTILENTIGRIESIYSTRAMAFAIKGLYYYQNYRNTTENINLIQILADRLVQMYKHESTEKWEWFEGYLTYANSILPEALLYTWSLTKKDIYKEVAISSLEFLLSKTFTEDWMEVISNNNWLQKGQTPEHFGEQPIDVAYTVMTLSKFFDLLSDESYHRKMEIAFSWFLGNNRLHQIIYNPCTGGCYDGLEAEHINLNQGAESTISCLIAQLAIHQYVETMEHL